MNDNCQLDKNKCEILNPGSRLLLDPRAIKSYSIFSNHSVFITNEGNGVASGDNIRNIINPSLPWGNLSNYDFSIKYNMMKKNIISAMCGWYYTLYLISISEGHNILGYAFESCQSFRVITVINSNPIALFGGGDNCASIDSNGKITYIPKIISNESIPSHYSAISLPNGEKAISVSCCDKFILALSFSGRVYMSEEAESYYPTFSEVYELKNIHIVNISGCFTHAFAVSNDGKVYGIGLNYFGKLGLSKDIQNVEKFVQIQSLNEYKILEAYAGRHHSLFLTSQGRILACGSNFMGEFPNVEPVKGKDDDTNYFDPIDTGLSGASFCIAGNCVSAVFFNGIPSNMPNKAICDIRIQSKSVSPSKAIGEKRTRPKSAVSSKTEAIEAELQGESQTKIQIITLKKRIDQLEKKD